MAHMSVRGGKYWIRWRETDARGRKINRSRTVAGKQTADVLKAAIEHDLAVHGMYLGATTSASRKRKVRAGFVYFVVACSRIKIGHAVNVVARVRELQIGCPFPLTLIGTLPGTVALERHWHRAFEADLAHGEWFHATPELVGRIGAEVVLAISKQELAELTGVYGVCGDSGDQNQPISREGGAS